MALGTAPLTVTTQDKYVPEVWAEELRAFREINLVAAQVVKRYPFEGSVGDTIHIPDLSRLTVITPSEGGDDANSVNTEGEFNGVITRHRGVRFQVPDRVGKQSKYDLKAAYTASAGKSLAEDLDAHILALESGFQGGVRRTGNDNLVTTSTIVDFTDAGIRAILERLDIALVPQDGRYIIAHPRQKSVFLAINRFVEYQSIGQGNMPIRTGLLGEIYGVPVYFTTNVASIASGDVNLVGQQDAILLAMQMDVRVQMGYILQNLSWLVYTDYIGQAFEFRDDHAVAVITPRTHT